MSKETDNNEIDNEWGISDIEEAGKSLTDNPPTMEDSATKAFGGQMPVKDVTADLTNVISSQIIVDAVKNSTVAEEYIEDYAVDGELFTEDYINEGLEEALGEYEEEPEYYDEEELPYEEEGYYQEPEPYIPVSKPKNSNNVPKPKKNRVVEDDEDDEEEDDNKDKLLLIGSIVVFILVVILGIVLILKLHGNDKKPVVPDTEIGTETDIDDITSNMNISVDTGEADKPDENPAPAEPEKTECEKNGHKYKDATCVEPKICEVCGKKDGKALGHDFATADCTKPTTCKRCGKEGTDTLGHKFKDATCESPKTCERCGVTEGEKLPHEFEDATCQKPKTCKLCGLTEGEKAEHVFVEESKTATTGLNVVEGMQFDKGYISPYMVTDTEKMEAILDNPYILITDKKISNIQEILPLLESLMQSSGKLVIIADDIEGEVLSTLLVNKLRGVLNVVAVKAPGYGDKRKEMLEDIAILTGGEVITSDLGLELKDTTVEQLGRARQVKVQKENTIIVDGIGDKSKLESRVNQIRKNLNETLEKIMDSNLINTDTIQYFSIEKNSDLF